jgi:hypothetical protein
MNAKVTRVRRKRTLWFFLILLAGFSEGDTPYKFVKDRFLFTLLVDDQDRVFGMTLEF